jgi:hypothetical protein
MITYAAIKQALIAAGAGISLMAGVTTFFDWAYKREGEKDVSGNAIMIIIVGAAAGIYFLRPRV